MKNKATIDMTAALTEQALAHRNWTGLTMRELAKAGRLSGAEEEASLKLARQVLADSDRASNIAFDSMSARMKFLSELARLIEAALKELNK